MNATHADVQARWVAVHERNLGPVPVDTIQQKVLPFPWIRIPQAYLDGLETLWRGQGACVEGFEGHVLKLHKPSSCWAHKVILDFEGLIPHKETKSRFCSVLTSRSQIQALGNIAIGFGEIVSRWEDKPVWGRIQNFVALSLPFSVGSVWDSCRIFSSLFHTIF